METLIKQLADARTRHADVTKRLQAEIARLNAESDQMEQALSQMTAPVEAEEVVELTDVECQTEAPPTPTNTPKLKLQKGKCLLNEDKKATGVAELGDAIVADIMAH